MNKTYSFMVKCPYCKHVFSVTSPPQQIKCPNCHSEFSPYQHIRTSPKVVIGIVGFMVIMMVLPMIHAFSQFGKRRSEAADRIKTARKSAEKKQKLLEKQRIFETKIKEMKKWKTFALKNLHPFSKHSDFSKDISKFNFKIYGSQKPAVIVYEIYYPYKYSKIKQAIRRRRKLLEKYPSLAWVYIPVSQKPSKDKDIFNLIFEITEQKKGDLDDLMKKFYIYGWSSPKYVKKIIERIPCNRQSALKAIKTNKFKEKIKDFAKVINLYDLSDLGNERWAAVLKNTKTGKYFKDERENYFDYSFEEIVGLFLKYPDFQNLNTKQQFQRKEEKVKTVIIKK